MAIWNRSADQPLYIVHSVYPQNVSGLIDRSAGRSLRLLLTVAVLIVLTLAVLIWLLVRRISRPVAALGHWAHQLDADRLKALPPDFVYPELNELAALIRNSLRSVQNSLVWSGKTDFCGIPVTNCAPRSA